MISTYQSRYKALAASYLSQAWVEVITQPIAGEVQSKKGEADTDAGYDRYPPLGGYVDASVGLSEWDCVGGGISTPRKLGVDTGRFVVPGVYAGEKIGFLPR